MKKYQFNILVFQDEDGLFVAQCPALKGCYSQGDTFEKAIEHLEEAIEMCLEEMKEEKKSLPKEPHFVGFREMSIAF